MQTFYQFITEATPPPAPPSNAGPLSSGPSKSPASTGAPTIPSSPPMGIGGGPPMGGLGPSLGGPLGPPMGGPEQGATSNSVSVQRIQSKDIWTILKKSLKREMPGHKK
jgi:hypothetical protein